MKFASPLRTGAAAFVISLFALPALAQNDPVVAVVNGEEIHRSALESAYKHLPPQYQQVPLEQIYPALLNSMIDTKLTAAAARSAKIHETERFKKEITAFSDRLLGSIVIQQYVEKLVTDAAVSARYAEVVKQMGDQGEVHARHILVKTEAEAKTIIKDLAGGADFAELAKKKSTGPSGPNGGDLGFFGKGQMVPAFEKAAFALADGEVTKAPVKTQFGWHVIKVDEKRSKPTPSKAEMEPQIRQSLSQEAGAAYAQGLRKNAKIERFNLDGTPAK